ncbi:hypothetical protein MHYP_G00100170 [Metynnis hypsauchen]
MSLTVSLLVLLSICDLQVEVPERVIEGDNVTLTCKTTCRLTVRPTFTWYRNGRPLSSSTDQLHLQSVSREDAGRYHCAVLGQNLRSPEVTLNVRCWYRGEKRAMHFAVPRIWREPTDHSTNCYFCMVDPSKHCTGKNATPVTYPDIPSSIAPVPHCPELPVPTPPDRATPPSEESSRSDTQEDVEDHDFSSCADEERKPYYPNQKDLNDLIRDLGLTKSNAELLTSRLKQWNLLDESVQVTGQSKRHQVFSTFFSHQDGLILKRTTTGGTGLSGQSSLWGRTM